MLFENGSFNPSWLPAKASPVLETQITATARPDGSRYATGDLVIDREQWRKWLELGHNYPPEDVVYRREQARNGRFVEWFAYGDELQRGAFVTEMLTLREDVEGADYRFLLPRGADEDGINQLSPADIELAKRMVDYCEDVFLEELPGYFSSAVVDSEYMGIGGAAPHWIPRGYQNKWKSLEEIEQVPSRHFEFYRPSDCYRVWSSWTENKVYRVDDLVKRGSLVFLEVDKARPVDQRGMLWALAPLACISSFMLQYWAETCQDEGKAVFAISFPQGNKSAEAQARATLEKLAHDLRVAHPDSLVLQFLQTKTEGRGKEGGLHQQLLTYLKRDFGSIILGHSHATSEQVGTGSRTGSEKADKNTIQRENGILRRGARNTRKQLIFPAVVDAVGLEKARLVCPRVQIQVRQTPDYESESRIVLNLSQAGLRVNQMAQAERVGYELAENAEGIQVPAMAAAIAAKSEATLARPRVVPALPEKTGATNP